MFGRKKKPPRVIVRRYKALTNGGVRKDFEKDAQKLAEKGYRVASSVDHAKGRNFYGAEMMVTYELVDSNPGA